jgi:cobalt-zinc-cadmium efflux system outer membrane protein
MTRWTRAAATVFLVTILGTSGAGCASYHPKPIVPRQTAADFEKRSLADEGLKKFIEKNLKHDLAQWPPGKWDVVLLTLAAYYYNPDLDTARAQWETAKAAVVTAGAIPNPSLTFTPGFNSSSGLGLTSMIFGVGIDIPIETAGKRCIRIAAARHLAEVARLNVAWVAWQVRSRVYGSLLDLYRASEAEALMQEQYDVQTEIAAIIKERLEAGEASQPDMTQAAILRDQMKLQLADLKLQAAEARGKLAGAIGMPAGALAGAGFLLNFAEKAPVVLSKEEIQNRALVGRPDILAALEEYAASEDALKLEIAKQYPDIDLGPGYEWDQGDHKWSIGLTITLPIFNHNQGPIAEAEGRRAEAAARFTGLQAQVIGEVQQALVAYDALREKLDETDSLLKSKQQQVLEAQASFEAGEGDRLALLGAQLEYYTAALDRLQTAADVNAAAGLVQDAMQYPLDPAQALDVPFESPRPGGGGKKP